VCFVARTNSDLLANKGGGTKEKAPLIKFSPTVGIVAEYYEPQSGCRFKTALVDYAKRVENEFTLEEEKRKLYVAATRAECKLIFTGFAKGGKVKDNSYLNWIIDNVQQPPSLRSSPFTEGGNASLSEGGARRAEGADNNIDIKQIDANIAAEYSRQILTTIPKKLTATQIGTTTTPIDNTEEDEKAEPTIFPRNPSFHGERRFTAKKRGDAYHKAMELIDFYVRDFASLQSRFTPLEWNAVNSNDIDGFFRSELGRRAVNSDKIVKEYKLYTEIDLSELGADKSFIQGIADMFFYEDGEIVLVDYKTNRNTTAERLIHDYRGQLLIYKRAIEEMTGHTVKECWIYSFEIGEIKIN